MCFCYIVKIFTLSFCRLIEYHSTVIFLFVRIWLLSFSSEIKTTSFHRQNENPRERRTSTISRSIYTYYTSD